MSSTFAQGRRLLGRKSVIGATVAAAAIGGSIAMTSPASAATANWDAIAARESGGNWSVNTGNGYGGGLQISPTTSAALGGPSTAAGIAALSKSAQIALAEKILAVQGPHAWPNTYVSGGSSSSSSSSSSSASSSSVSSRHVTSPTHVTYTAPSHRTYSVTRSSGVSRHVSGGHFFTTALAGQNRSDVAAWQAKLVAAGYHLSVDGHYGAQSAAVARQFQTDHGLLVDGIVGPQTWGATFG